MIGRLLIKLSNAHISLTRRRIAPFNRLKNRILYRDISSSYDIANGEMLFLRRGRSLEYVRGVNKKAE